MKDRFNWQDIWERDIERSPMRYTEDACRNCGYRNRPSMSKDVCSTCILRLKGRAISNIYK
jgi:hypothetical protein